MERNSLFQEIYALTDHRPGKTLEFESPDINVKQDLNEFLVSKLGEQKARLFKNYVQLKKTGNALTLAYSEGGVKDEESLTGLVYFSRYDSSIFPLGKFRERLLQIRDTEVRPFLQKQKALAPIVSPKATSASLHDLKGIKLGTLVVDTSYKGLSKAHPRYDFTQEDAVWLARFIVGEAGGDVDKKDNIDNHAVVYAMFNRFGAFRQNAKSWTSFQIFIRKYSTTLQPMLKSFGAAKRVYAKYKIDPIKFPIIQGSDTYIVKGKDTGVKEVQSQKHISLQKKPWDKFPEKVRVFVINILKGQIPNPGIGLATEFANTFTYYKSRHNNNSPTKEQWVEYTKSLAATKKWIWIGEIKNLNQMKENAFFLDKRLRDIPADAIKVVG